MTGAKKNEIANIATAMLRDRGYEGVSMNDIALAVGLKKSTLYSHFKNKDDLASFALNQALVRLISVMSVTGQWRRDFVSAINSLAEYLSQEKKCLGWHLLYGLPDGDTREATRNFFNVLSNHLKHILSRVLSKPKATHFVEETLSVIEGATLWLMLNDDEKPMKRLLKERVRALDDLVAQQATSKSSRDITEDVQKILKQVVPADRQPTAAEITLAEELSQLRGDYFSLEAYVEADSCFK